MNSTNRPTHRNKHTGEILLNKESVCPLCHQNFGTTEAGDKHRRRRLGLEQPCHQPADVGLVATMNRFGSQVWRVRPSVTSKRQETE